MASRILLHCLHGHGGLAEHAHYQARAFLRKGDDILVLCPEDYLQGRPVEYRVARTYRSLRATNKPTGRVGRVSSAVRKASEYLCAQWKLAWHIIKLRPDFVLLDSYMEYLSPLWVWPHLLFAKSGFTKYAANLHDPVRDFVVGPAWWHKLSVALAYSPLKVAVVHQSLSDPSVVPKHVHVVEAPVGVYDLTETAVDPDIVRSRWGVPPGASVFLCFGFIRDNKNIDLLIKALREVPEAYLVVVGSAQSSLNKPLSYYQDLALRLGVSNRVVFREEFVPDESLASYFAASDVVVMTYNSEFRSQSGVLNIAARARRPVLASGGESPLKSCVQRFALGEFVEPDSLSALIEGMRKLCRSQRGDETARHPDWDGYSAYASWDSNVTIISSAIHAAPVDFAP